MAEPSIVAVVGATGVLGRHLVPRLIEQGFRVRAIARRPDAPWLRALSAETVAADILDRDQVLRGLDGCAAVIHAATSIPKLGADGDWSLNDRIRREGTQNLLDAASEVGATHYVQQSIAMLSNVSDERPQTEDDAIHGEDRLASAVEMEALVTAAPLDWRILRGGLFVGPGTGRAEALNADLRNSDWRLPGDGTGWLSLIHVADMAAAMVSVLTSSGVRGIYNAVDDEPVTWRSLCAYLAAAAEIPLPAAGGPPALPSFRVSNARLRATGWAPRYPSYRSLFAADA